MQPNPTPAAEEIYAYLSLRDQALAQLDEDLNKFALERAEMANNFAIACLKPGRIPYQAQCLSELTAKRERQRCAAIAIRLKQLRARLTMPTRVPAFAA